MVGGAYAYDPQGWKRPWRLWVVGLWFNGTEGAQVCPQPLASDVGGHHLGAQHVTVPEWVGQTPSPPLLLLLESPSCLPLLISPATGVLILSGLHFSSPLSPPTSYQFTWGFLPSLWVPGSPTSGWQVP